MNNYRMDELASGLEADPMNLDADIQETDSLSTLAKSLSCERLAGVPLDATRIHEDDIERPWKDDVEVGFTGPFVWGSVDTETVAWVQAAIAQNKGTWQSSEQFFEETDEERLDRLRLPMSGAEEPERDGIPPIVIRIGSDGKTIAWQEGRHRSIAAMLEGINRIPVKFVMDTSQEGDIPADYEPES